MDTTKTRPEGKPRQEGKRPQGTKKRSPEEAARKRPPQASAAKQRSQEGAVKQRQQPAVKKTVQKKKSAPQRAALSRSRMTEAERNDVPNRKRSYGKSKPKKNAIQNLSLAIKATAVENAERRRAKAAKSGKKRPSAPTPAIIYTQPKAFNRNRLVVQLVSVLAIVLALVMGMSVFFKVGTITVSGADVYTVNAVEEASGIQKGDSLFGFSRARSAALIVKNLPYVKNVSFGIKLPETVNIIIEEEDVVYSIQDQTNGWWLMNSDGRVVEMIREGAASNYTKVLGVNLLNPVSGQRAEAMELSDTVEGAISTEPAANADDPNATEGAVVVAASGEKRLAVALEILKALEDNDVVGSAASVNVAELENIELWYGTRYQVELGDDNRLHEKIDYMTDVIAQMSDYQSGILDISFRIWTNQVGYTPFSAE